jgi:hypothetical protein
MELALASRARRGFALLWKLQCLVLSTSSHARWEQVTQSSAMAVQVEETPPWECVPAGHAMQRLWPDVVLIAWA